MLFAPFEVIFPESRQNPHLVDELGNFLRRLSLPKSGRDFACCFAGDRKPDAAVQKTPAARKEDKRRDSRRGLKVVWIILVTDFEVKVFHLPSVLYPLMKTGSIFAEQGS